MNGVASVLLGLLVAIGAFVIMFSVVALVTQILGLVAEVLTKWLK